MVIKNVNLEIVCGITSKIPDTAYNEVAFAGKSNVGKSSLINALMNRKALARTSAQPGKTQTINFYNINDAMYLVDLPGYGYAKASEEVKAKWGKMIENYTEQQPSKVDFSALMEKTDKLAALKEKYQELTGKRKSLDLFAISHDNQNAQIQIVDAKGQSFESSNPKCIKEVIDIWMKDFAKAIEETEKEIRNLYAC